MSFLDLLVLSLATFRLSLMVSKETGPMFMFRKLRAMPSKGTSTKVWLSCQWCLSVAIASVMITAWWYLSNHVMVLLCIYGLAISGGAVCINQQFTAKG